MASIYAIACILSYDGLSGISLPAESVDSLTSMVHATELDKSAPGRRRGLGQNQNGFLKSLMSHGAQQTASAPSHYHKARTPAFKGKLNNNEPSSHNFVPTNLVGMNPYQRPPLQGLASVGYCSGMYGPLGPRGDTSKRQRGNALK